MPGQLVGTARITFSMNARPACGSSSSAASSVSRKRGVVKHFSADRTARALGWVIPAAACSYSRCSTSANMGGDIRQRVFDDVGVLGSVDAVVGAVQPCLDVVFARLRQLAGVL